MHTNVIFVLIQLGTCYLGSMCCWWRISDPDQLKLVAEALHEKEHAVALNFVKYMDYANQTYKPVYKDR